MNGCFLSVDLAKSCRFRRIALSSQIPLAMATVKKTVRVAAAQMTSVNDLMANYATCSRLVHVIFPFLNFHFQSNDCFSFHCFLDSVKIEFTLRLSYQ